MSFKQGGQHPSQGFSFKQAVRWTALSGLLLLTALLGCQPARPAVSQTPLTSALSQRMQAAVERPNVDRALDEFVEKLFEDPLLASEGNALWEASTSSPELAAYGDAVQEELAVLPAMQALVVRLMQRHPGATAEQIGKLA